MNMREDMLILPKGTILSNQNMTRFQKRLKVKMLRGSCSRDFIRALVKQVTLIEEFDEGF